MAAVLVADDAAIVRKLMTEMLEDGGHTVVGEAATGEEAVRLFAELRPDVAVIDVNMPQTDGVAAARAIREAHPEATVILASVFVGAVAFPEAADAGAVEYLQKPFDAGELVAAVERAAGA